MATASECYALLCNIRSIIVEQLALLGYPVDAEGCMRMCITDLVRLYSNYTGRTYTVDDLDAFINDTVPSAEWLNKVVECNGQFATCIEVNTNEYQWTRLDEESTIIEHTINSDGVYNASDFAADGFSKITVDTSAQRNLQNKTVTPSSDVQVVYADKSFIGLSAVTVKAVQTQNANIAATKERQTIIPEEGTFFKSINVEPIQNQTKTVIPTTSDQNVIPEQGYDGLDKVVVRGDAKLLPENIVAGVTIFGTVGNAGTSANGKPIEIYTEAEMDLRRSAASASTAGTVYKYKGPTGNYITNNLYVVTTNEPYALERVESMLLTLDDALVTLNGDTISWTPVPFATAYYIIHNDHIIDTVTDTTFTLSNFTTGIYALRIAAYAPGYHIGDSNTVVYYVGATVVNRTKTLSFPVGNNKSIATTFNNRATFICSSGSNEVSTILQYDTDDAYYVNDAPIVFHAVASTADYMFLASDDAIYAYDENGVYTIVPDAFYENNCKAGVALGNYCLFDVGYFSIVAIDNTLITQEISYDTPGIGYNDWSAACVDRSACANDKYAVFGSGRFDYEDEEIIYSATVSDSTSFTDRVPGYTIVDTDLVSSTLSCSTTTLSCGAAATNVGPYLIFAGGKLNNYTAKYGYVTHDASTGPVRTYLGHEIKSNSYSRAIEFINRDLVVTGNSMPRYFNNACATSLGDYALIGGGENLKNSSQYFDDVLTVNSDLVMLDTDKLSTARSRISATTLLDKAIFAGGGSAVSSSADVYGISIAYE